MGRETRHQRPRTWAQCLTAVGCLALLAGGSQVLAQRERQPTDKTEAARVFQAGAATSNITPPLGGPIVGGWEP
ncbi:hypothetical protein AMJ85_02755, partial [candidate division BRC1 bacterium SM23_51]